MASFNPKSLTIQSNSASSELRSARRRERSGGEVVACENAARAVKSIQPADPLGRFLNRAPGDAPDLGPGRDTPCVMRFIVDDQDVPGARQVAEHASGHTLRRSWPLAFVDAAFAGDLRVRLPVERMPDCGSTTLP